MPPKIVREKTPKFLDVLKKHGYNTAKSVRGGQTYEMIGRWLAQLPKEELKTWLLQICESDMPPSLREDIILEWKRTRRTRDDVPFEGTHVQASVLEVDPNGVVYNVQRIA